MLYRVIAVIGIASMVVSGVLVAQVRWGNNPKPEETPTAAEMMWGAPAPVVVNRVVLAEKAPVPGLVNQPILGYQEVVGQTRQPPYLFGLKTFTMPDAVTDNGFIGTDPSVGLVALDTARLVVRVAGDPQCFPHAAVVNETDELVSIAIYYGRAAPKDGPANDALGDCKVLASGLNISTLIPIRLSEPLGNRIVVTLTGELIAKVALIE